MVSIIVYSNDVITIILEGYSSKYIAMYSNMTMYVGSHLIGSGDVPVTTLSRYKCKNNSIS